MLEVWISTSNIAWFRWQLFCPLPQINKVMIASELFSRCNLVVGDSTLKAFALNRSVSEALSKVVLGSVTAAMSAVTDNRNDKFPIFLVVSEDALESIAQVIEVIFLRHLRLKNSWLNWCCRLSGHLKARFGVEEVVLGGWLGGKYFQSWSMLSLQSRTSSSIQHPLVNSWLISNSRTKQVSIKYMRAWHTAIVRHQTECGLKLNTYLRLRKDSLINLL